MLEKLKLWLDSDDVRPKTCLTVQSSLLILWFIFDYVMYVITPRDGIGLAMAQWAGGEGPLLVYWLSSKLFTFVISIATSYWTLRRHPAWQFLF